MALVTDHLAAGVGAAANEAHSLKTLLRGTTHGPSRRVDVVADGEETLAPTGEESLTLLAEAADAANRCHYSEWEETGLRSLLFLALSASSWVEANQVSDHIVEHADPRTAWLCLPDLIEARAYGGRPTAGRELLERLEHLETLVDSAYLTAVAARSRALLGDQPLRSFHESIEALQSPVHAVEQARSRLLFGEWLRLRRRSGEATHELTLARDALLRRRCYAFAARASRGLAAATSVFSRSRDLLTYQEREVATRAAAGSTNAEIGQSLFLSRHTIDYHLRKVFQKLGVSSRRELSDALIGLQNAPPVHRPTT